MRSVPATPLPVQFTAHDGFVLEAARPTGAEASREPLRCRVRRAAVQFERVRGDTVYFSRLLSHERARGAARCALEGPGIIALTTQPSVRSETARSSVGRSLLGVLGIIPALLGAVVLLDLLIRSVG